MKILFIDDDKGDQALIQLTLERSGISDFSFVSTGEEGLKVILTEKPDIVVTDTNLPGINGFEVCQSIKNMKNNYQPKVIVMTGQVDAVDATKARQMGADDYVVKTSDNEDIVTSLQSMINE